MNSKAQANSFDLVFIIIVFFLLLGGGLGYAINTIVGVGMQNNQMSGLEALPFNNFLLIVIGVFILAVLWRSK
jgi:hypothetical protein